MYLRLCLIQLTVFVIVANGIDVYYSGRNGIIYHHESILTLNCTNQTSIKDAFLKPLIKKISVENIKIHECEPSASYTKDLESLNIDVKAIESIEIVFSGNELIVSGNSADGLEIQKVTVIGKNEKPILTPEFLEPLKLTSLETRNVHITHLPSRSIETLILDNSILDSWTNCTLIENLNLTNVVSIPKWPKNCSRLKIISLALLSPIALQDISANISAGVGNIEVFQATSCKLSNLPYEILNTAKNLDRVILTNNYLHDSAFSRFPTLEHLTYLDISNNSLTGSGLQVLWNKVPNLLELHLDSNDNFYRFCSPTSPVDEDQIQNIKVSLDILQNSPLEILSLDKTAIDLSCFINTHFSNLQLLILSNYVVTSSLRFEDIPKTNASDLRIEFGDFRFHEILFYENHYQTLKNESISSRKQTHLTLIMGDINCDCEHGWLARALRDFPNLLTIEDLQCRDGTLLLEQPLESIECTIRGYNYCLYRKSWKYGTEVATCKPKRSELPEITDPIVGLVLSRSNISVLHSKLPQSLQWIDLRHNRISRANTTAAAALFANDRRVWLEDNLLDCECDNELLDAILRHRDQVEDFDSLTCVGSGRPLTEVSMVELCQVPLKVSLSLAVAVVAAAATAALVWWRYGERIKIFLYTRGVCLWCLRQPDLDDGMEWDAFLSFAHGDEQFVCEQLLPRLENAPEQFRVCVHYRDWVVGDWIPEQIMRSVHASKRTLILLSRNFVRSTWSSLEFRYALAHAAQHGGLSRLLVLVLDDVLQQPLDDELTAYLAYNTYLRCDDPWFWEKLRYALPHRGKQHKQPHNTNAVPDINQMLEELPLGHVNSETNMIQCPESYLIPGLQLSNRLSTHQLID